MQQDWKTNSLFATLAFWGEGKEMNTYKLSTHERNYKYVSRIPLKSFKEQNLRVGLHLCFLTRKNLQACVYANYLRIRMTFVMLFLQKHWNCMNKSLKIKHMKEWHSWYQEACVLSNETLFKICPLDFTFHFYILLYK